MHCFLRLLSSKEDCAIPWWHYCSNLNAANNFLVFKGLLLKMNLTGEAYLVEGETRSWKCSRSRVKNNACSLSYVGLIIIWFVVTALSSKMCVAIKIGLASAVLPSLHQAMLIDCLLSWAHLCLYLKPPKFEHLIVAVMTPVFCANTYVRTCCLLWIL